MELVLSSHLLRDLSIAVKQSSDFDLELVIVLRVISPKIIS